MGESDEHQPGHQASFNLDQLLEQRERIEAMIKNKYTRVITVMFTDLKGSTRLAESQGDVATRLLIKRHNDIVFPSIAAQLGINTGLGIVEKNDLFGDVVNVASRFETLADPGEILISESTCEALGAHRDEFSVRLKMTTSLKEKSGLFKAFKVCLSPEEFAEPPARPADAPVVDRGRRGTDRLPAAPVPGAVGSTARDDVLGPEERAVLGQAKAFEEAGEYVQLYLLCGESPGPGPLAEIGRALQARLAREQPLETNFSGKSAL